MGRDEYREAIKRKWEKSKKVSAWKRFLILDWIWVKFESENKNESSWKGFWRTRGEAKHWNSPLSSSSRFTLPYQILPMGSNAAAVEKTEDDLRKEIDELQRQQREVFLLLLALLCVGFFLRCVFFFFSAFQWCIYGVSDYRTAAWSSRAPERGIYRTWTEKLRCQWTSSGLCSTCNLTFSFVSIIRSLYFFSRNVSCWFCGNGLAGLDETMFLPHEAWFYLHPLAIWVENLMVFFSLLIVFVNNWGYTDNSSVSL